MSQHAELVDAYWTQYRLATSRERSDRLAADDWQWAAEAVDAVVEGAGDDVVPLLVALADAASADDAALAYLGAGPIENVLRHRRPPSPAMLFDRIEGAAERNEHFRRAVRCVWWADDDDPELVARFQRFGPPL